MNEQLRVERDLSALVVPRVGQLVETGNRSEPYVLVDAVGERVAAVAAFLADLQAASRPATTLRSYGLDLLRWFRFLWAVQVDWDRATRVEARDFMRWLQVATKPPRGRSTHQAAPAVNPLTGKSGPGPGYAPTTRAHAETVVRGFYEFHRDAGGRPIINPFPKARAARDGRAHAHHNPMQPLRNEQVGLYRPKLTARIPRSIPDELFDALFLLLPSHRDRALVALYVSTGARASELLGARQGDVDAGQQLVTVVRKGSRAVQQLPASPDAFVWLRLYQEQIRGRAPFGRSRPLWWTLRPPARPLSYHATYAMFRRVNAALGANWSLHDLRHTAAYRLARDPAMPLTDVQWVLGHAHLSTTQQYLTPRLDDVLKAVQAHHARRGRGEDGSARAMPADGYRRESLDILFGGEQR